MIRGSLIWILGWGTRFGVAIIISSAKAKQPSHNTFISFVSVEMLLASFLFLFGFYEMLCQKYSSNTNTDACKRQCIHNLLKLVVPGRIHNDSSQGI